MKFYKKSSVILLVIALTGCSTIQTGSVEKVLSAEEQSLLTPDKVIKILREGNERFATGDLTVRNHKKQVRESVKGQYPKAIVLSCVDSRVPVEDVFDRGIGDLFVARVAGNFVNKDIIGSMEFATKVAGAKLILVMGHEHCGAVKAAINNVQLGSISSLVKNISPAVKMSNNFKGNKTAENQDYVHAVCENNVINTINQIRKRSKIISDLEKKEEIKVVGAVYDMDTGKVVFL